MGKRKYVDLDIRGTVYPTVQAAAAALRVRPDTIRLAARKGTLHRVGLGAVGSEPMPIRIRGQLHDNARAAAEALGVGRSAIYQALACGRLDEVGLPRRQVPWNAQAVEVDGVAYPSLAAASRAMGHGEAYLSKLRRKGGRRAKETWIRLRMIRVAERDAIARRAAARRQEFG